MAIHSKANETRSAIHAYEQRTEAGLPREMAQRFRRNRAAWAFFPVEAAVLPP